MKREKVQRDFCMGCIRQKKRQQKENLRNEHVSAIDFNT